MGWLPILLVFLLTLLSAPAKDAVTNQATMKISGFGLIGNLELKKQLRLMQADRKAPRFYRASHLEDAALILLAKLKEQGYLDPAVFAEVTLPDGRMQPYQWTLQTDTFLPPDLLATEVAFFARRGVRSYYEELDITGLEAFPVKEAKQYFIPTEALLRLRNMRVFTPEALETSAGRIRTRLNRGGYVDATVRAHHEPLSTNGAIAATVVVTEGLPTRVRSVAVRVIGPTNAALLARTNVYPNAPLSRLWEEDFAQSLRTNWFYRGFPDARVELAVRRRETNATLIQADLEATVHPGTNIVLGAVRFEGRVHTRPSVLRRFSRFAPGEPLDRIEIEQARERLTRLGTFDSVVLRYEPVDARTRNAVYELKEGKAFESKLLVSYGSYDLLGGGVELTHRNMLGLAHHAKLRAAQTFKSTLGDFRYTMPEVFRQKADLFLTGTMLFREELSFDREEYGGGVGLHRYWPQLRTDTSVRYDYQFLSAISSGLAVGQKTRFEETRAAAIILDFKHDRRDNPLHPRMGYKFFGNLEFASDKLGGQVNYQRFLLGGSTHWNLGGGRYVHTGATHGFTFTWDGQPDELPFNKRFFPGGDNSVRGFQHGEAAPRNALGEIVGAETFLLGNLELEQFLTRTISVVGFFDAVGFAESRAHYPFDTGLYSAGAGLRWKTVIGPVRLEYGRNLNPRANDPDGTLHVSFGFPF